MNVLRVAVVGYGVAGATAAAILARQGHSVEIYERADRAAQGSGLLLQPSGQLVLERLGLLDGIARDAEVIESVDASTPSGRRIAHLVYRELGPDIHGMGIQRPLFFAALDRAARAAGARIHMGTHVDAASISGASATLVTGSGERLGPFDLVIGADGLDPAIRRSAGLVRWSHRYRWGALWAVGPAGPIRGRLHMAMRGTTELVGLLPLGRGRCNLFWSERLDGYRATRERGFDAWRDRVISLCPEAGPVLAELRGFEDLTPTAYGHVVTAEPRGGPVVLIGDAAHAMSPHTGQGVNLALIDAYTLASIIGSTDDLDDGIRRYVAARRRQLRFYGWLTLVMTPFFQSDGRAIGWLRDVGLPVVERLPYVRHRIVLAMSGLTAGFRGERMAL